jgi:hypothetical protein
VWVLLGVQPRHKLGYLFHANMGSHDRFRHVETESRKKFGVGESIPTIDVRSKHASATR